jgi:hypothetical protein
MPLKKSEGMLLQHAIVNPNEKKSLYFLLLL